MDEKLNALDKLIEAVEAGRWWDDLGIAASACNRAGINNANEGRISRAVNGSLDAALALHEALLPGWWFQTSAVDGWATCYVERSGAGVPEEAPSAAESPARAWLIAILRAYRSMQP